MTNLPVEFLDWDSNFFHRRIARITTNCLLEEDAQRILAWAREDKIDCLYYLADGNDVNSTRAAEANGFRFTDLKVTTVKFLQKPERPFLPKWHIRRAKENDLAEIKHMVRDTFRFSRFHVDDHFEKAKVDEMYEIWIENDLHLNGHTIWLIEVDGVIASINSISVDAESKVVHHGLAATLESWRGKGLQLELLFFEIEELRRQGFVELVSITQGRNIPTINLVQRAGYHMRSIDLWYHKWFEEGK